MNLSDYLKTWEGCRAENRWGRMALAVLACAVVGLSLLLWRKDTVVVIEPFTLNSEATITRDSASRSYMEAWGFALSELLGNVTPSTVDFIKKRIGPLLAPKIYSETIASIDIQARQIRGCSLFGPRARRETDFSPEQEKTVAHGAAPHKRALTPSRE